MSKAKTYRRRLDDVQAFAAAFSSLLDVCEASVSDGWGMFYPSWTPRPGREQDAARLAAEVDRASGRAAIGLGHEFFIDWKPRGTFQTQRLNPAAGWRVILDHDPPFPADAIFAVCNQAIGVLEARTTEAEEHEHSLVGRLERITGTARRNRRRQGVSGGHLRTALLASIVGIPSTLLVAYIVFRFGWG